MKQLRKSTYLALIGLLVAALALATATYAWFVANATVTVEQIHFSASAASGFSIAIDDGSVSTEEEAKGLNYKGRLTNEDFKVFLDKLQVISGRPGLQPVSTVSCAAFYENDGFNGEELYADKFRAANHEGGVEYLELPVWFLSTTNMDLYLDSKTKVTVTNYAIGAPAEHFDKVIRIGFAAMPADDLTTAETAVVYEPNTAPAPENTIARKSTTYCDIAAIATAGRLNEGYGVAGVDSAGKPIFAKQETFAGSELLLPVTETGELSEDPASYRILTRLQAGIPKKVILYLWMEGTDWDCVDGISGSTLKVELEFFGNNTETP